MEKRLIGILVILGMMLCSCAFMKDVEGAWSDKKAQKAIKGVNSVVDALKEQHDSQRYFYKLLVNNAQELSLSCDILNRAATDSYLKRVASRMDMQARDLGYAARRENASATEWALQQILDSWDLIDDYVKPSLPPVQPFGFSMKR